MVAVRNYSQDIVRMLIVDDEDMARRLVKRIMDQYVNQKIKDLGYKIEIEEASDPISVLEGKCFEKSDIVLTDHKMFSMCGATLTRELRKEGYENPVIGMSADLDAEERFKHAGANDFVYKFDLGKLLPKLIPQYADDVKKGKYKKKGNF